jgi:hypothetical protein
MKIDFDNLTSEQLKLFNSLRNDTIKDYNEISSQLIDLNSNDECWLFSPLTGRNTYFTSTLRLMQSLRLVYEISKTVDIDEIVTSDYALSRTLKSKYNVRLRKLPLIKDFARRLRSEIWSFIYYVRWCIGAFASKNEERARNFINTNKSIIVDTFIAKKTQKYFDRYYGSVYNRLRHDIQDRTYYLAQYILIPKKNECDAIAKKSDEKIIYLFDFLSPIDYIYSFGFSFYYRRPSFKKLSYVGYPMKYILNEQPRWTFGYYYCSTLLYKRLLKKLSMSSQSISLIIDWFENQSYDKAIYYYGNKYLKDVEIHAFQGFMPILAHDPHCVATNCELKCHAAPSKLYLCNNALKSAYVDDCKYPGYIYPAPFFRTQKVFSVSRSFNNYRPFTILVPMGLDEHEVNYKTKFFKEFLMCNKNENVEILLKPHPVYNNIDMSGTPNNIKIVSGDIYESLVVSDAVIAGYTTVVYESLALGIPVITLEDDCGRILIDKPANVDDILWYKVKTYNELNDCIGVIKELDVKALQKSGIEARNMYFNRETPELVDGLFTVQVNI